MVGLVYRTCDEEPSDYATNATTLSLQSVVEDLPPTDSAMTSSTTSGTLGINATMSSLQSVVEGLPPTDNAMTASTTPGTLGINVASEPAAPLISTTQAAQQCTLGSFRGLKEIFPPYICSAVCAKNGKADLTMDFPYVRKNGLKLYCLMSLVIKASEIPHIALRLFKAHISIGEDGVRYHVLPGGARLFSPDFRFQGSLDSDIKDFFGSETLGAIDESPVRGQELDVGIIATGCVSMSFSNKAQDNGTLSLSLGFERGVWMKNKLFG